MPWFRIDADVLEIPAVNLQAQVPCARARRGCANPARWATCPPCGHQVLGCDACRAITDANVRAELALGYTTTACNTCDGPVPMPIPWRQL